MARRSRYSPEVRERAVRLVMETEAEHASQWAAIGPSQIRGPFTATHGTDDCARLATDRAAFHR